MGKKEIRYHRAVSWGLALLSLITIVMGYSLARGWIVDIVLVSLLHRIFALGFIAFLVVHMTITLLDFRINWQKTIDKIRAKRGTSVNALRLAQRVSAWMIVVLALLVVIPALNGFECFAKSTGEIIPFAPHRVFDVFLGATIIVHVAIGLKFLSMRKRWKGPAINSSILALSLTLLILVGYLNFPTYTAPVGTSPTPGPDTGINIGQPRGKTPPRPGVNGFAIIEGVEFWFNSSMVETTRPDIFRPGAFSMFDVAVHLAEQGNISLEYHFNESLNTHQIDQMQGKTDWWYKVIYSGGWSEVNVFRMDQYIWKEGTSLEFYQTSSSHLEHIYETYQEEVERLDSNNGKIIVPEVQIQTREWDLTFEDVEVTAHDLRNDVYQEGVITAIDVIMSLGDQEEIDYELKWYDSIADATVVRSYWVHSINGKASYGTCGFVYDQGSQDFYGFSGNHIHLPSDTRPMVSPDYARWFWICI